MDALAEEFLRAPEPAVWIALLRLIGAATLCSLIGLERGLRDQAAGVRTNMLVGLAAATFAILATSLIARHAGDNIRIDPLRLIEAVTGGVAFLAAGLIVFSRGEVRGLTTGATVWLSAAVGLAVGLGQWLVAVVAAGAALFILIVVRRLERRIGLKEDRAP
jgi:putative Mg2+ transporter-C (MgtC) family protein